MSNRRPRSIESINQFGGTGKAACVKKPWTFSFDQ